MATILSALLVLLMSSSTWGFTIQDNNQRFFSRSRVNSARNRLSKPLIGDDGRIYACSDRNLFAFENNGTIAWTAHLNYTCNLDIAPVIGHIPMIYLVAENRVVEINGVTSGQVFFVPEGGDEIIGISASTLSSTLYITVKTRALFAYAFHREFLWSIGPAINLYGYLLRCSQNPQANCFFNSAPVIDHCESQIYISNTQGQIYAVSSTRNHPRFTWIRDLSYLGKDFSINAGNNGRVYITVPDRDLIMALRVSDGNILWQKSVGALDSVPPVVVDSNGFISVGSLDGWMYSISPSGVVKKYGGGDPNSVIQVNPIVDCSGYGIYMARTVMESDHVASSATLSLLVPQTGSIYWSQIYSGEFSSWPIESDVRHFVLDEQILLAFVAAAGTGNSLQCRSNWQRVGLSCSEEARQKNVRIYNRGNGRGTVLILVLETAILMILGVLVRYCCVFWRKRKLRGQGIASFLEKRRNLVRKKKVLDRSLAELKKKKKDEEEDVEEMEKIVQGRRDKVKKKLLTTYSLGPDRRRRANLYNDDGTKLVMKSFSFQDARTTSNNTMFHPIITSPSSSSSSSCSSSSYYSSCSSYLDVAAVDD